MRFIEMFQCAWNNIWLWMKFNTKLFYYKKHNFITILPFFFLQHLFECSQACFSWINSCKYEGMSREKKIVNLIAFTFLSWACYNIVHSFIDPRGAPFFITQISAAQVRVSYAFKKLSRVMCFEIGLTFKYLKFKFKIRCVLKTEL
jgi:hypothetical protein